MKKASSEPEDMVLAGAHLDLHDPRLSEHSKHAKRHGTGALKKRASGEKGGGKKGESELSWEEGHDQISSMGIQAPRAMG